MEKILQFKRNATILGLCGEYKKKWDECNTKQDLVDMALDSNGVEFMADSIAFGWGLSKDYLLREFGKYANGAYKCHEGGGYTSEMYVGAHGTLKSGTAILLVAYCDDLKIVIPEYAFCRIYVCGGSKILIENNGKCEVLNYGPNDIKCIGLNSSPSFSQEEVLSSKWSKRAILGQRAANT